MNKKDKTLKAYLYVVFMRIGKGVKAQLPVNGRRSRTVAGFVFLFNKQFLVYFPGNVSTSGTDNSSGKNIAGIMNSQIHP